MPPRIASRKPSEQHADYIRRETLAKRLERGIESDAGWHRAEGEIDGLPVIVAVRREQPA